MAETPQRRRILWVRWGTCLLLGLILVRLVDLQVVRHDRLMELADRNTQRAIVKHPMRGQIRDIRGNPLASSVPARRIFADPSLLAGHQMEVAHLLAPILKTNEDWLVQRLNPQVRSISGRVVTNSYVVLARGVPIELWQQARQAMTNFSFSGPPHKLTRSEALVLSGIRRGAIGAEEDQVRTYPNHALAAHVLGFVRREDPEIIGCDGIEDTFNAQLTGVRGWRQTEVDVLSREIVPFRNQDVDAVDGLNVILTLDARLQLIVETELAEAMKANAPASVSCLVIRPKTGEILAAANLPNFDPNSPGIYPPDSRRNRLISDVAEPGSTFKIVVVSGAINDGVAHMADVIDCGRGLFLFAGHELHDHLRYGLLDLKQIIAKSSNIGAAKVGIMLGDRRLSDYIQTFGFGQRTGVPLPGEVRGIVWPVKDWTKVSIAQIPMGQGIAVTPLQMAMAMGALANHGTLMQPMLVNRLESSDGHVVAQYLPHAVRQVVSETTAFHMVEALKAVVGPEGTARSATMENFTVAGKTGTAQKPRLGIGGYYSDRYYSSFIGFFPADDPALLISVVMDDPHGTHFGSQVAAPVFKRIALKAANYLNIAPDLQPVPAVRGTLATGAGRGPEVRDPLEDRPD